MQIKIRQMRIDLERMEKLIKKVKGEDSNE